MIDFHSHILPHFDDGSRSTEESIAMLKASAEQGVDLICSTSHYYAHRESPDAFLKRRQAAAERLQSHLTEGLPEIRYGAEVQYFEGICNAEDIEELRLRGTNVLLLEMPFSRWTDRMTEDVIRLNRDPNFQVMLAHIERYLPYNRTEVLEDLHEEGVILQSNASFFLEWKTRGKAMRMLKNGTIDVLGSDCHNTTSRKQEIGEARERILRKCGQDALDRIDEIGQMLLGKG
ncbi:MAG: capsular polysaccharide biosynthesis protein [Oscillospiraceae bacterium]|nr:capsular polysaccharide biosynthesis protein [Oscillospiraceae bacterium]